MYCIQHDDSTAYIPTSYIKSCNCSLQVYVTECIGVDFVGYIIISYAVSSSLGSFVVGKLLGLVNYNIVTIGNVIIHVAVMLFLIIWEREPNYAIIFVVPFIWGLCFGSWLTITISKFCIGKLTIACCKCGTLVIYIAIQ